MYEPRAYRDWVKGEDLVSFNIVVKETDLYIRAKRNLRGKALEAVLKYRAQLEKYTERHPAFLTALEPLPIIEDAPNIAKKMAEAAEKAGVGPMAAVAGAMAECVGMELIALSPEIIVSKRRDRKVVLARQVAMYLMREENNDSFIEIGKVLGNRNHATAMHGYEKIGAEININPNLRQHISHIRERIAIR